MEAFLGTSFIFYSELILTSEAGLSTLSNLHPAEIFSLSKELASRLFLNYSVIECRATCQNIFGPS
jgi:hypothetical protein